MQKQILGNFFFYEKKQIFECFSDSLWPAFGHGRLGHPQSLEYLCCINVVKKMQATWSKIQDVY